MEDVVAEEPAGPLWLRSDKRMLPVVKLFVYTIFRGASVFEVGLPPEKNRFVDGELTSEILECL